MSNILEFVVKMQDMMSGAIKIAGSNVNKAFKQMQDNNDRFQKTVQKTTGSINDLNAVVNKLKYQRDAIKLTTPEDVMRLRVINSELNKLQANLNKRNTMNGSRIATMAKNAFEQMPGAGLISNPLVMAGAAAAFSIKQANEKEMQLVKYGTLMGSDKKGADMYNQLKGYSDKTPYQKTDILAAGENMLNYGVTGDSLIKKVDQLGNISGGSAQRLQSLSLAFGQIYAKGHLAGQELLQMVNAGFNPLLEISRTTGQSMDSLSKAMEKGQISVAMVEQAMATATGSGGRFHGMMEKLSQTFQGKLSTFMDQMANLSANLGAVLLPVLNKGLMVLNNIIGFLSENLKTVVYPLGAIAFGLAAANASAIGAAIGFRLAAISSGFLGTSLLRLRTMMLEAFATNPVTMWIAAIGAAMIVAYEIFKSFSQKAETANQAFAKMANTASLFKKANEAASSGAAEQIGHAQALLEIIKDENVHQDERLAKLKELKSISKEHFGNMTLAASNTDKATTAMQGFSQSLMENIKIAAAADFLKDVYKSYGETVLKNMKEAAAPIQTGYEWKMMPAYVGGMPVPMRVPTFRKPTEKEVETKQAGLQKTGLETLNKVTGNIQKVFGDKPFKLAGNVAGTGTGTPSVVNAAGSSAASSVAASGPRVINIHGVKFMDKLELHTATFQEGKEQIQATLEELFLRVLQSGAAVQS